MTELDDILAYLATELLYLAWPDVGFARTSDDGTVFCPNGMRANAHLLTGNGMLEIMNALGEQRTWEFLRCEGRYYAWLSNNNRKISEGGYSFPEAVARVAYDWMQEYGA